PALDVRDGIREDLEGVVGRDHGDAEHVTERNEHEEVLEVHSSAQRGRHVTVGGHPVEDALHALLDLSTARLRFRRVRQISHLASLLVSRCAPDSIALTLHGDPFSTVPPSAAAGAFARASATLWL